MTDGIVPPDSARIDDTDDDLHENIWVPGSHVGLGFNAAVMWILANRLAQPEGELEAVRPGGLGRRRLPTLRAHVRPAAGTAEGRGGNRIAENSD